MEEKKEVVKSEKREKREKRQGAGKNGWIKMYLTGKVLTVVIAAVVLVLLVLGVRKYVSVESKTTKIGFEDIGELATQAAYCTEVNVTEASRELWGIKIPFTQSKYIYSYDVVVKAGFDFSEVEWSEKKGVIEVKLPQAEILSCEVDTDTFQVYHEDESIFRKITLEENNEALNNLMQQAEKDAVANGILEDARSNAERILKGFFGNEYDLNEYELKFTDK